MIKRSRTAMLVAFLAPMFWLAPTAQAQEVASGVVKVTVTSCVVYSTKTANSQYDCIAEAREALGNCQEVQSCEIPIGHNLTPDRDVEPGGEFLSRMVKVIYSCGTYSMQSGPYEQDDHATLVLDCSGMWW